MRTETHTACADERIQPTVPHVQDSCQLCYTQLQVRCVTKQRCPHMNVLYFSFHDNLIFIHYCLESIVRTQSLTCRPATCSVTWELPRNADSQAPPISSTTRALYHGSQVIHVHLQVWEVLPYCLTKLSDTGSPQSKFMYLLKYRK